MLVSINTSGLKQSKWYELATRFVLGGLVTAGAAAIAKALGPSFGGLFLAFPAILAASVTLVEKHERERKEQQGMRGVRRGRQAAAADAAGASLGSVALLAFAWFACAFLPSHSAGLVITAATVIWVVVAMAVWWIWKRKLLRRLWRAARTGPRSSRAE